MKKLKNLKLRTKILSTISHPSPKAVPPGEHKHESGLKGPFLLYKSGYSIFDVN